MNSTLIIRPTASQWQWLRADEQNAVATGSLEDLSKAHRQGDSVALLLPGPAVIITRAKLPPGNSRQIAQALPYTIEDSLAVDPESCYFARTHPDADGKAVIAACDRTWLDGLLNSLGTKGINPSAIYPETLCLPLESGTLSVLDDEHYTLLRSAEIDGLAIQGDWLENVLPGRPDDLPIVSHGLVAAGSPVHSLATKQRATNLEPLQVLLDGASECPIDFRQGELALTAQNTGFRRWRAVAALGIAVLITALLTAVIGTQKLASHEDQLAQQIASDLRQLFPEIQRVTADPLTQAQQALAALRGQMGNEHGDMLGLLATVAPSLKAADNLTLEAINYRNQRLTLEVTALELTVLEQLQVAAREEGLVASLESVNVTNEQVAGVLAVEGPMP